MKKLIFILSVILIFLIFFSNGLAKSTGLFQLDKIDDRDLERWEYENGFMKGSNPFVLEGHKETCWIMVHGYTLTPAEYKDLSMRIYEDLGDTVYALLLSGHGQVPSKLLDKSTDNWYDEVHSKFIEISQECKKVNVAGSSTGAVIALKLAEQEELNNVYLLGPYIHDTLFRNHRGFLVLSNVLHYTKKKKPSAINDPEGLKTHLAYMNLPLPPVRKSHSFIDSVVDDLDKIKEDILILHSVNDLVAHTDGSKLIIEKVSSNVKEVIWYEKSNHVLLKDYDREDVINDIIKFEKENR